MPQSKHIPIFIIALTAAAVSACSSDSSSYSAATEVAAQAVVVSSDAPQANTAPVVNSVTFAVQSGNAHLIVLDALDNENDSLTWDIVTPPGNGSITGTPPMMMYQPDDGFVGPDHFEVTVSDGELSSPRTTIALVVSSLLDAPVPVSQSLSMLKETSLPIALTTGGPVSRNLFYILESFPQHGRLTGSIPDLVYTPNEGFEGTDQFHFSVGDENTLSPSATINITVVYPTQALNDTGVTWGANYPSGNNPQCVGETVLEQDCSEGNDAEAFLTTGSTGFQFTKLDDDGKDLPTTATDWRCVRDDNTGLMWEVKSTSDNAKATQGIEDPDDVFSWFETNPTVNAGATGYDNSDRSCSGYDVSNPRSYCNTEAFTQRVNEANVCGFSDWRLPTRQELDSLVSLEGEAPLITTDFFPETLSASYWSATPSLSSNKVSWTVSFTTGEHALPARSGSYPVRLVREAH